MADLDVEGIRRTKALEEDLDHFFGKSWRTKEDPEALVKYIEHLKQIAEEDEPLLLVAYIYHLYMGLLSGGQILSKKRQFFGSDTEKVKGTAVTTFEGIYLNNYFNFHVYQSFHRPPIPLSVQELPLIHKMSLIKVV